MRDRRHGDPERHVVEIGGRELTIELVRSPRRTLSLRIDERGLRVNAPHAAKLGTIDGFIRGHAEWIGRQVGRLERARLGARLVIDDGARLPVFGEEVGVRLVDGRRSAAWQQGSQGAELLLPRGCPLPALERALRRRARVWFGQRVEAYCDRLGEPVPAVALSSARRRWGSCSRRSGIRLHWKLALLPAALADYVVAHEVSHLREMNHSKGFWDLLATLYPDWRGAREALRARAGCLPEFVLAADPGGEAGER
ncbi:MAG: M48 family metallopeptidase [Rhodocyclaceae bacterium]|nr:M48 family metallopeptidase [Rhodocyclaceae bacterium]